MYVDRITCPRCGANNFTGQPTCWQCKSSLPPPDALGHAGVNAGFAGQAYQSPRKSGVGGIVVALVVVVILFGAIGAYVLIGRPGKSGVAEPGSLQAKIDELKAQEAKLRQSSGLPPTDIRPTDTDPLNAQAQRTLQDLKSKAGGMGAQPSMGNGDIRLQMGGSISKDEYQKALDSVKNSGRYRPP